jgi:hypothetical protein
MRRENQADLFVSAANIREALHGDRVVAPSGTGPRAPRAASSASSSGPTSGSWAATRRTPASAATWCRSIPGCCTRCSCLRGTRAPRQRDRWSRSSSPSPRRPPATPSAASSRCSGGSPTPAWT